MLHQSSKAIPKDCGGPVQPTIVGSPMQDQSQKEESYEEGTAQRGTLLKSRLLL
jgi:hypothetical protein